MQTSIIYLIRDITRQLDIVNQELAKEMSDEKIKALLRRNDILVKKRSELSNQLGLTSLNEIL